MSLKKNRQKMLYARRGQKVTVYERDENGEPKFYETDDGEKIYFTKTVIGFSEPVEFAANIAFSGGEARSMEYGFNSSDFDAIIVMDKGGIQFEKGDIIWFESTVSYKSDGQIDETSADFTVVGVKPGLESIKYVLKAVVK